MNSDDHNGSGAVPFPDVIGPFIRACPGGMSPSGRRASRARIARCLGFSDGSSWSRFARNLTGKTPTQQPDLPLRDWVLEARRRVFLDPHRPSNDP